MRTTDIIHAIMEVFDTSAVEALSPEAFSALIDDLHGMATDHTAAHNGNPTAAAREMLRCIGGDVNLAPYTATLLAGVARRERAERAERRRVATEDVAFWTRIAELSEANGSDGGARHARACIAAAERVLAC